MAEARSEWRPPSENESGVTLRMPISTGECFSALRNVSRWIMRRSMPIGFGYRLYAASATFSRKARAGCEARRALRHAARAAKMRAQERAPLWNDARSYFSLGE